MQAGEVARRVGCLVDRAPVCLHAGACGSEIVEQEHERARVVADLRVPAARGADPDPVPEHGVEPHLVAVPGGDALAGGTIARRGLGDQGARDAAVGVEVQAEARAGLPGADRLDSDGMDLGIGVDGAQDGGEPLRR